MTLAFDGRYAPIFYFLDTVGDQSGTKNAVGNYAGAVQKFICKPIAGEIFFLSRMMIHVEDVGSFDTGSYGNRVALTNGIDFSVWDKDDNVIFTFNNDLPIKQNVHWARFAYDTRVDTFGTGNSFLIARWSFFKSGQLIKIDGDKGEYIGASLNDDFTGLVSHYFNLQGFKYVWSPDYDIGNK